MGSYVTREDTQHQANAWKAAEPHLSQGHWSVAVTAAYLLQLLKP